MVELMTVGTRPFQGRRGPGPNTVGVFPVATPKAHTVAEAPQQVLLDLSGRPLRAAQPQPPITLHSPWPFSCGFIFERGVQRALLNSFLSPFCPLHFER